MARRARSSKAKGQKKKESKVSQKPEKKETASKKNKEEARGLEKKKGTDRARKADASSGEGQKKVVPSRDTPPQKSPLREWYEANRNTIFILLGIFVFAFLIREYFYYQISFNTWPPNIVGNDPSYHKRVIDFIQSDFHHMTIDPLLNYPISGGNPRPPVFDWSIALIGIALSPIFGFSVENSTWWVFEFAPTFWGAMTIFPMYLLGKEIFGRKAGILAAFFLAITASHIERSTLGFTDHDSFIVFFLVVTMYFMAKAFSVQKDRNYIADWRKADSVLLGFRAFAMDNKEALLYAFLAGLSIATIALTWQGFAYVLAILLIYFMIQLLLHRFRNEDALGTFMLIFVSTITVVLISLPYYFVFSITIWSQGFYILLAMTVLGVCIVPTRDIPWLLVIPTLALLLFMSYFILQWGFPETADLLFTGGGYFVKSKLYSTIAEAQAPDISRVVFTYGPATFFLGLVGVVMAAIKIPKRMRKDYIVIIVWTAVAIYMSLSAVRFNFNATPAFALLAGWVVVKMVDYFKAEGLAIVFSILATVVFFISLLVLSEGWNTYLSRNLLTFMLIPIFVLSIGFFGYMKYKKKREYFKFRKVLTALGVGFLVIFPNLFFAIDAAIPTETKSDFDPNLEYLGSFGSSLHSEYWMDSYEWLAKQDILMDNETVPPEDRPAFMSWWDYGFDELLLGKHPTTADNFQNGYQFTGSMIASSNESEAVALMTARLLEGDWIKNDQKFSDKVWDILVKYLGDDSNSTKSAYEIQRIYNKPGDYIQIIENNPDKYGSFKGLTWPNARYAAARGAIMYLGEEGIVNLYHDVREATGRSLRYFAVDYRLFPFSSSNTGIFYAPITLADRDTQDFLEYKVYAQENTRGSNEDPVWTDYPDNPITMEKAKEESERLGYKFRIQNYEMYYTDLFYNSLFYRTYIGYSPEDVGLVKDGKSVPGISGDVQSLPPMQGWNMTHWKLVYRTYYYSEKDEANATFPDDYKAMESKVAISKYRSEGGDVKSGLGQGVFYLMYYDGAIVEGRVRTERGVGVPGARVTVLDDFGIPHGNVITGPNGEYSLIVPPGEIDLVVTEGELVNQYDKLYQFQMDQSTGQPTSLLNSTIMEISDDLAMRRVNDGKMSRDLVISGKELSGKIYWDIDEDSSYTEEEDELVQKGDITFVLKGSDENVYPSCSLEDDGSYRLEDLVPGNYDIVYTFGETEQVLITDYKVDLQGESTKDIRIDNTIVQGNVKVESGYPAQMQTVILTDPEGETVELMTDLAGNFSVDRMFPGIYTLKVDNSAFTHDDLKFYLDQGDDRTFNITLLPKGDLELKVNFPAGYRYSQYNTLYSSPAAGSIVYITDTANSSHRWSSFLDDDGVLSMGLPVGSYDIQVYSVDRNSYWAYISEVDIVWKGDTRTVLTLERAIRVNGTLTKLAGTPMNNTDFLFIRESDGVVARVFTNNVGNYQTYLPIGDYRVKIENTTYPGNVTYFHMQDLPDANGKTSLELDLKAFQTAIVTGRVYWDKDHNKAFTTSEDLESLPEGAEMVPIELGLEDITIQFEYSNGSIPCKTGSEGEFVAYLPPGEYLMKVMIDGFYPFTREVIVENSAEVMNFGLNDTDAPLEARERQLQVNLSMPYYGRYGITYETLSNRDYTITASEPYMAASPIIRGRTDADGVLTASLAPGDFILELMEDTEEDGNTHHIVCSENLMIEPSTSMFYLDGHAQHLVEYQGRMFLVENSIIRYPAEISVNFNAIQGMKMTISSSETDFNGNFQIELQAGDYILEAHQERPGTHYMYWDVVSVDYGVGTGSFEMVQAFPVQGSMVPEFDGIADSELFFVKDGLWTGVEIQEDGDFSAILFIGIYTAEYNFQTVDNSLGDDIQVEYYHTSTVEITGARVGLTLDISKNVEVTGAVYYDVNNDRTIQLEERKESVNVTFTPVNGGEPIWTISDANGDFSIMVPYTELFISVDSEGYKTSPREDVAVIDLPQDGISLWDIPLVPDDVIVNGIVYIDIDLDGSHGEEEPPAAGLELIFVDSSDEEYEASIGSDGSFEIGLPPDIYTVRGMRYSEGRPIFGYIAELNINMGDDLTGQEWPAVPARRVSGTVMYWNTDGELIYRPPEGDEIVFTVVDGGGEIKARYSEGTYVVDLPYYNYYISSSFITEEYDMDMTYRITKQFTFNSSTTAQDLAFEFEKNKEYTFQIDLVNELEHELEMGIKDTVRLEYFIENVGNEPFSVTVMGSEIPEGWTVEFPEGEDVYLGIGEEVRRWVNITTPSEPDFFNSLVFQAESDQNTKNTFQVQVRTPSSYRFDIIFDIPQVLGVGYDEMRVFNITVENFGTGEDVVNIQMDPRPEDVEDWKVEWEGSPEFPSAGENASLLPKGVRKYAVTVWTPESSDSSLYNEKLTLAFTCKNRIGDVVKKTISIEVRKPNLVLPPGFLKITNRRITDPILNRTLEANITVRSLYRDSHSINVSLMVDGELVADGVIPYIPQDGTGSTRVRFNITDFNITEDDFHSFEVLVDPYNTVKETDDFDNAGVWYNVVIGKTPESSLEVNWRIFVFAIIVILVALGIIAYRQRTQPI
ncbi:MAG: glycosyltransferase family 39 protein [Candidatus Thermoplasmatota archaeon]|nr:glycosyltransferase family 39 protein [Candidatus Thermoplasmatota archaeon]